MSASFIAPTDEDVILYHQVWDALRTGSSGRPALPPELVLHITGFCHWVLPYRVHTEPKHVSSYARSGRIARKHWFSSPPLEDIDIKRIAAIQLITISKDQGWASDPDAGSWSWFEVGIEDLDSGLSSRWKSHHNKLCSDEPEERIGPFHPVPDEGWQAGDTVGVWACAQFGGWCCEGEDGRLRFYRWFRPAISLENGQ